MIVYSDLYKKKYIKFLGISINGANDKPKTKYPDKSKKKFLENNKIK